MIKIATWNINSLRVRLPHVLAWLKEQQPDILALQEIKMVESEFPYQIFEEIGYLSLASGQKTYNGVAILSKKQSVDSITDIVGLEDPQRRVLGVTIQDVRLLNLYVPNGESVTSLKYQYKLDWLQKVDAFIRDEIQKYPAMLVVGDFNIAPEDIDVHDPKAWQNKVLFSAPERKAFADLLEIGLVDCFRKQNPTEVSFSWWDYRVYTFRKSAGLRIDHILASGKLANLCEKCYIDKAPRDWERPSDHAPVVAEFNL